MSHWARHPHVRTGKDLTFGERAADRLKATFGSWAFLIVLNVLILGWIAANVLLPHASRWDIYPGDRIASEVAMGTYKNGEELLALNQRQMEILARLDGLDGKIADLAEAVQAVMAARTARAAKTLAKEAP